MRADNTHHLLAAAERRHQRTLARAKQALQDLRDTDRPITVTGLAALAGVSRAWLYGQPELRAEIERLRRPDHGRPPAPAGGRSSDASLLGRLKLAHDRIHELTNDNQQLRDQIARLHGELRRARLGVTPVEDTVHNANNLVSLPTTPHDPR